MTSSNYTLPKGYLSASSIGTLLRCPKQFEFRYIENIILPPTAALVSGSVSHKVFEQYYNNVILMNVRLTPEETAELANEKYLQYLDENEVDMTTSEKEDAAPVIREVTSAYVSLIAENIVPVAVEQEVRKELPCGVDVLGYIDLEHTVNGDKAIADYKITSKKWSIGDLTNSLQFNIYSMITGIRDIQIHNMTKSPTKVMRKPKEDIDGVTDYASNLRVLRHVFDSSHDWYFNNLVESSAKLITAGVFTPCDPTSWCCNANWCGYWWLCRGKRS